MQSIFLSTGAGFLWTISVRLRLLQEFGANSNDLGWGWEYIFEVLNGYEGNEFSLIPYYWPGNNFLRPLQKTTAFTHFDRCHVWTASQINDARCKRRNSLVSKGRASSAIKKKQLAGCFLDKKTCWGEREEESSVSPLHQLGRHYQRQSAVHFGVCGV